MRILSIIARDNATLGTAVEFRKWCRYFESMGIEVHRLVGDPDPAEATLFAERYVVEPGLSPDNPDARSTLHMASDSVKLTQHLERSSRSISGSLRNILRHGRFDALYVDALFSFQLNLPASQAILNTAREMGLRILSRAHNFPWDDESAPIQPFQSLYGKLLPVSAGDVHHATLTPYASRRALKHCPDLQYSVVPNLFPLDLNVELHNNSGRKMRVENGIDRDDLLVLQPSRCIPSKGVHNSVHAAAMLGTELEKRVVLGLTAPGVGFYAEPPPDNGYSEYEGAIRELAERLGVRIVEFGALPVCPHPSGHAGVCIFSGYGAADLVTYASLQESFGNPVMEAALTRKPILVSRYPVLQHEFLAQGFQLTTVPALGPGAVSANGWNSSVNETTVTASNLAPLLPALAKRNYERTEAAQINEELVRSRYAESRASIEHYLRPLIDWMSAP